MSSVAGPVIPVSGSLGETDILELSRFHTSIGLMLMMSKELDQKLIVGMAERRKTESSPDEKSQGGGQWLEPRPDPKSPLVRVWLRLV